MSNGFADTLQLGATQSATFVEKNHLEGYRLVHHNMTPSDLSVPQLGSVESVYRLVKNSSGGTLSAKTNVKHEPDAGITETNGVAGTADLVLGVVDQYLGSTTVADGEYFFACVHGPHLVTSSASYNDNVTLAPAASGQTAASSTPPNAYDFATSIQEATAGSQEKLAFIHTGYH